ncbi:hypothetical protein HAX54_002265 [Datura stramonium]|uniref:Uncharacterized protein n=1 Tax=Datura stramonium TaxID=4076 RepID=A0ABS8WR48_DATST|nr:hypothetical protein [Datura stramonium]
MALLSSHTLIQQGLLQLLLHIQQPGLGTRPAPFMAAFSSIGPNTVTPEILKPDITAPGVSIIAAYTGAEARTRDNAVEPMLNASLIKTGPFAYGAGHVRPNRAMDPGLVYDLTIDDYLSFLCAQGYNETQIKTFTQGPFKCPEPVNFINMNLPSITVPNLNGSGHCY